jgi:hypothetical protein
MLCYLLRRSSQIPNLFEQYQAAQHALDLAFERGDSDLTEGLRLADEVTRLYYAREHEANLAPVRRNPLR